MIKNNFLNNFVNSISLSTVAITLCLAFVFSVLIYFIYQFTCDKTIYSKKFNVAMCLMTIITSALVMSMQANVVISLGMVGALSIVRFRTAIKEPKDLLFLFWAISNGIIIGAGLYSIAIILLVVLSVALLIFEVLPVKQKTMLLVINMNNISKEDAIEKELKKLKVKYSVKSRNVFKDKADVVYEINTKQEIILLKSLSKNKDIISINLIKQD